MWQDGRYLFFKSHSGSKTTDEMIALWESWLGRSPIVLIEDPLGEKDWAG
jgi:enolase